MCSAESQLRMCSLVACDRTRFALTENVGCALNHILVYTNVHVVDNSHRSHIEESCILLLEQILCIFDLIVHVLRRSNREEERNVVFATEKLSSVQMQRRNSKFFLSKTIT